MTSSALKRCSFVEYLALEETSEIKHEYYDGEIFAMAEGTGQHGIIAGNCIGEARAGTKDRGCRVFTSDVKVLTTSGLGTYPDASIVCEEPRYEDAKKTVLLNPLLIIEVLSDSTEAYDRGKKFEHYQSIESLQEYVLVSQDRAHVDRFTRQANDQWLLAGYSDLDSAVELPALACSIPMAEIYRGVEFPPASAPEAGEPSAEPAD